MILWRTVENYLSTIMKYPPYLFHCMMKPVRHEVFVLSSQAILIMFSLSILTLCGGGCFVLKNSQHTLISCTVTSLKHVTTRCSIQSHVVCALRPNKSVCVFIKFPDPDSVLALTLNSSLWKVENMWWGNTYRPTCNCYTTNNII